MVFPGAEYELPENWSIEPIGNRTWRVWCKQAGERVELVYCGIERGIVLLDIDLACRELPAFDPVGTSGLTLNIGGIGMTIEPVTSFFGMSWRTFVAFLGALMAKEAMLGVLAALYASADPSLMAAASGTAAAGFSAATLASQIPGPEALAFLFACAFNVPCVMTLGTTHSETHSLKWTLVIALFYFVMALCISFVVFHVASLFM